MTIAETIARAGYSATDAQVSELTVAVVTGLAADSTYLRVLVALAQGALGTRRRVSASQQMQALDTTHSRLYGLVQGAVGPEDLEPRERNRRANFARSAASTVRLYLRTGGDLRALKPEETTKTALRKAAAPEGPTIEQRVEAAAERLIKTAQALAEQDPQSARNQVRLTMDALEDALNALPEAPRPHRRATVTQHPRAPAQIPAH